MLESTGLAIGVVTSIVGIWKYEVTFTGAQNHAGTTRLGPCSVAVERLRTGTPAIMDARFQRAIEAAGVEHAGGK